MITAADVQQAFEDKLRQLERTEKAKSAVGVGMPATIAAPVERERRTSVVDLRAKKGPAR